MPQIHIYFQIGKLLYDQLDGATMESPLSPIVANIYREELIRDETPKLHHLQAKSVVQISGPAT